MTGFLILTLGLSISGSLPIGLACLAASWIIVYFFYDLQISKAQLAKDEMEPDFSSVKMIVLALLTIGHSSPYKLINQ